MDPDACYEAMLEAWRDGDATAAAQHLGDLCQWLIGGGFPPTVRDRNPMRGDIGIVSAFICDHIDRLEDAAKQAGDK